MNENENGGNIGNASTDGAPTPSVYEKIKTLCVKYRELIVYVIVGGFTSVIGMGGYWLLLWLGFEPVESNVLSWILAVLFAFFANKKWVFRDSVSETRPFVIQIIAFVSSRLFSLGAETLLIWLGTEKMAINEYFVKIPVAVLVVILNYITGKFIVFARGKNGADKK